MPVNFYLGQDLINQPRQIEWSHESTGCRTICDHLWQKLERQKTMYAVLINPGLANKCEISADMAILSEMGLGVLELKNHKGEIDCSDPFGEWKAGSNPIEAGVYKNPHLQVQDYADMIRTGLLSSNTPWLKGEQQELATLRIHTAVCFTNPAANLAQCKIHCTQRYIPKKKLAGQFILKEWELFSVLNASETPGWAWDMRFERRPAEEDSGAEWYQGYRLLPQEVEMLAERFFNAQPFHDMHNYVQRGRKILGHLTMASLPQASLVQ